MTPSGDQTPDPTWRGGALALVNGTDVTDVGICPAADGLRPYGAASCGDAFPTGRAAAPGPNGASPSESVAGGGALSPVGGTLTTWQSGSCLCRSGEALGRKKKTREVHEVTDVSISHASVILPALRRSGEEGSRVSRLWQRSPRRPVSDDAFSRPSRSTTTQPEA